MRTLNSWMSATSHSALTTFIDHFHLLNISTSIYKVEHLQSRASTKSALRSPVYWSDLINSLEIPIQDVERIQACVLRQSFPSSWFHSFSLCGDSLIGVFKYLFLIITLTWIPFGGPSIPIKSFQPCTLTFTRNVNPQPSNKWAKWRNSLDDVVWVHQVYTCSRHHHW